MLIVCWFDKCFPNDFFSFVAKVSKADVNLANLKRYFFPVTFIAQETREHPFFATPKFLLWAKLLLVWLLPWLWLFLLPPKVMPTYHFTLSSLTLRASHNMGHKASDKSCVGMLEDSSLFPMSTQLFENYLNMIIFCVAESMSEWSNYMVLHNWHSLSAEMLISWGKHEE